MTILQGGIDESLSARVRGRPFACPMVGLLGSEEGRVEVDVWDILPHTLRLHAFVPGPEYFSLRSGWGRDLLRPLVRAGDGWSIHGVVGSPAQETSTKHLTQHRSSVGAGIQTVLGYLRDHKTRAIDYPTYQIGVSINGKTAGDL